MTKKGVLAIFNRSGRFLSPDEARANLRPPNRRSFYSYLLRLASQGLLERRSIRRGSLVCIPSKAQAASGGRDSRPAGQAASVFRDVRTGGRPGQAGKASKRCVAGSERSAWHRGCHLPDIGGEPLTLKTFLGEEYSRHGIFVEYSVRKPPAGERLTAALRGSSLRARQRKLELR
jgi:hypothetical protein